MATISSTGVGSGLDVNAIVTQLMSIERRPLQILEKAKSTLDTKLSTIGQLQSRISALRDAASNLTSLTLWNRTVATSAVPTAVGASSASGAIAGSYAVEVSRLASAQTVASGAYASADAVLGAGSLTIELGSYAGEPTPAGFTPKAGASAITVTVGAGEDSLAAIRDKINAAGAGVQASIVVDASGARLALRSSATGAENAFRLVGSGGLSALSFDAAAASPMTRTQSAGNAEATINGIAVTSASNKLDGVVDGLTLTLSQTTTAPVEVTVAADADSIKKAVEGFVKAFNDAATYLREQTKYDEGKKTGAPLQGDRLATNLQGQLRALLNQDSSTSAVFARLSDIGIGFKSDGTLETRSGPFQNAMGNLAELRKLLATDGTDTATSGFADRFKDFGDTILGSQGAFESRNQALRAQITANERRQATLEQRLAQTEERLRKQYQTLDTNMSQLSSLSNYMTQQIALMTRSSGNF